MKYNKIDNKERRKIIEKIREILSKYKIDFAIIFGSFATRNFFEDIDLVIKGEIKDEIINELENVIGFEFDIKDWDKISLQMKYFAIKEGIRIIFNNYVFVEERLKALNEYFDFQPIIQQYTKYLLSKI